jgi:Divergent InlB B-repeat domain/Immunoglobulin domain/Bacterial Ig domain
MKLRAVLAGGFLVLLLAPKLFATDIIFDGQPQSTVINLGDPFDLSAPAESTNSYNLTYQWRKNGVNIASTATVAATNSDYAKDVSVASDAGTYTCVVSDPTGSAISSAAVLTIIIPPAITLQPVGKSVGQGSNVTFTVAATGTAPLAYLWKQNGGEFDPGATNASLTLTNVTTANAGDYTVDVSNPAATVTSTNATLTVVVPPTIESQPSVPPANLGDLVQFIAVLDPGTTADSVHPVTYQWRKNGVNLGAPIVSTDTSSEYDIASAKLTDAGSYTVVARNFAGSITSAPAVLLLLPYISNTVPAGNFSAQAGSNVTFTVNATGSAPLSYQWEFNFTPIPGATTNKYTIHIGDDNQGGTYSVLVSNAATAIANVFPAEADLNLTVLPETNPPTLTITNPASGARWSNAVFNVTGTAADNGEVDAVRFTVNGDANDVYTATGTNNWLASFPAIPGTNTFNAWAVDYYNNTSTVASRSFFYVVPLPFTLLVSGRGTITTNWTGPNLEYGRAYTMSATAATGFKFTGWTGGVTSTAPSLTFTMQSNLVIQANFVDGVPPTCAITSPAANSTYSNNPAITVSGTASDNSAVVQVLYQLNGGAWTPANGTTSWQAPITLVPGANTFRVCSLDAGGNYSPTNSLTLTYWLIAPLKVATNGPGTVAPNYNGLTLILSNRYAMTATVTPSRGYVFTNWTGGLSNTPPAVLTNGPTLSFIMQSNLVLQANFVDVTKPTLTITNPVVNARFTNTAVTVKGTAADNGPFGAVYWRLGTNAWNTATGTSNWVALANPAAGTNVFSAYAADAAGNLSATSTVSFVYVGTFAPVVVQTAGQGTVTPNYNGQSLGLSQTYVITAAGTNGFAFTNWTGGTNLPLALLTNGPTLAFVMRSNLTLQANFVDVQGPTVTITNPLAGTGFSNGPAVTVSGTAVDNVQVAQVFFRLNGGGWSTASGTTAWQAGVTLVPGANLFSTYAVDASGNPSATNTLALTYSPGIPLVVQTAGQGTVTPNYNGQLLALGQAFTMTAAGTNGFVFTNWTGGTGLPLAPLTNGPTLAFVMQSNLVLQANFTDVQAPTVAITSPLPGGSLPTLAATVTGTAADNDQVAAVMFQLNGGAWTAAAGVNPWTAAVNLAVGTNTFSVYSVDASGNVSATNTVGSLVTLLQPVIDHTTFNNNVMTIYFSSIVGATYSLEYKTSLTDTGWTGLPGTISGTGGLLSLMDSLTFVMPVARIYRVQATGATVPPVLSLAYVNNQVQVSLTSQVGAVYSLAYKNSAGDASWTVLPGTVAGTGGVVTLIDPLASPATRFYRLKAVTP